MNDSTDDNMEVEQKLNELKNQAHQGRRVTREAFKRQAEKVEEEMIDNVEKYLRNLLEDHGVEDAKEKIVRTEAKIIVSENKRKAERIRDLEDLRSEMSFMPHIDDEVMQEMAEDEVDNNE